MNYIRHLTYGGNTSFLHSGDLANLLSHINKTAPVMLAELTRPLMMPDGKVLDAPFSESEPSAIRWMNYNYENLLVTKQSNVESLILSVVTNRYYILKVPSPSKLLEEEEEIALMANDNVLLPFALRRKIVANLLSAVMYIDLKTAIMYWEQQRSVEQAAGSRPSSSKLEGCRRAYAYFNSVVKACSLRMSRVKNKLTDEEDFRTKLIMIQKNLKNAVESRLRYGTSRLRDFSDEMGVATRAQVRAKVKPTITSEFGELAAMFDNLDRIRQTVVATVDDYEKIINLKAEQEVKS
jgi:hypothetical protein